jgi:hypothetical protein
MYTNLQIKFAPGKSQREYQRSKVNSNADYSVNSKKKNSKLKKYFNRKKNQLDMQG